MSQSTRNSKQRYVPNRSGFNHKVRKDAPCAFEALGASDGERGDAGSLSYADQVKAMEQVDSRIPNIVKNACWEEALKKFGPLPKRGTGPIQKINAEYLRRCFAWEDKQKQKKSRAAVEAAPVRVIRAVAAEEKLTPIEDIDEIPVTGHLESWEDYEKETLAKATHPENGSKAVTISFDDTPVEVTVPHGHKILAATRSQGDAELRTKLLSRAVKYLATHRDHERPVVVDVGSGASGVNAARRLIKTVREADSVYWHCMLPVACTADLNRVNMLQVDTSYIHYVDKDTRPRLGYVNVCSHLAKECDCMRYYGAPFMMACHAHYYFDDEDWHNLFKYTDSVETFSHVPEALERPVPMCSPEFKWTKVETSKTATLHDRLKARLKKDVLGNEEDVVFEPLTTHGTTYVHRDPRIDLQNGGFQMGPVGHRKASELSENIYALMVASALKHTGHMTACVELVRGVLTLDWRRVLWGVAVGGLCTVPANYLRAARAFRSAIHPPPCTQYTVKIINGHSIALKDGEEIAHVYKYMRSPICNLEPRITKRSYANPKMVKEVVETQLLTRKDPDTTKKIALAKCLRSGCTEAEAIDTVQAAQELTERLEPKNEVGPLTIASLPPDIRAQLSASALIALAVSTPTMLTTAFHLMRSSKYPAVQLCAIATARWRGIMPLLSAPSMPWIYMPTVVRERIPKLVPIFWDGHSVMAPSLLDAPPTP